MRRTLALLVLLSACAGPARAAFSPDTSRALQALRAEAAALRGLDATRAASRFLDLVPLLPAPGPRVVHHDSSRTRWYGSAAVAALPESARAGLVSRTLGEGFYYNTRYGSPLAYARPLSILAARGFDPRGRKILDFGYGTAGHLRLLAMMAAEVHGVDVDPMLTALYSAPGDQGGIAGRGRDRGRLTLHHGRWPAEPAVAGAIGRGYDLVLSKNTLKNGYLHPERPVDPRMLVNLGVGDTAFVQALAQVVEPGGLVMIYNLSPAPAAPDQPYKPWADGRCPFPRELWEAEGFEVLELDRDDSAAARAMGRALGWSAGPTPMDLERDLFGLYSLFRRR